MNAGAAQLSPAWRPHRFGAVLLLTVILTAGCQAPAPPVAEPPAEPAPRAPSTTGPATATGAQAEPRPPADMTSPALPAPPSVASTPVPGPDRPAAAPPPQPARAATGSRTAGDPAVTKPAPQPPKVRGRTASPEQNRFYARDNPSYDLLQKANDALAGFPVDLEGQVDWAEALRRGMIQPRAGMSSTAQMEVLDQDTLMTNTRDMPYVLFPHAVHTQWLACRNCHEDLFISERGANQMTMNDIFRGEYCGKCHDRVAFSTYVCDRCHTVPKQSDKK